MELVPFDQSHLKSLNPQRSQVVDLMCMEQSSTSGKLSDMGLALTGIHNGEVVFCFGVAKQWEKRHIVWSLMSAKAGKYMLSIIRSISRLEPMFIGAGRLEVMVRADFPEGCRLVERFFGFEFHHYEEKFLPDGSDALIYVRYI